MDRSSLGPTPTGRWKSISSTGEDVMILNRRQIIALWNAVIPFQQAGTKITLLDQDNYGHVSVEIENSVGEYVQLKLLTQGGTEEIRRSGGGKQAKSVYNPAVS